MINPKHIFRAELGAQLGARGIKYEISNWQINTEFGDLIFEPKRICIRYAGQHRINAAFAYGNNPDSGHIIKILMQTSASQAPERSTNIRKTKKLHWVWALLGFLFIAGCTYSVNSMKLAELIEKRDQAADQRKSPYMQRKMNSSQKVIKSDDIKPLSVKTDITDFIAEMRYYDGVRDKDKPIQYTFVPDTWLYENLHQISRLSQHQIIYDATSNFRIKHKIVESGRGSAIAKRVYSAINAQFGGQLTLVQCKNTSIITDKTNYQNLCS